MADSEKKAQVEEIYSDLKENGDEMAEDMAANFSPKDFAHMSTIFSMYHPLLKDAQMIQTHLQILKATKMIDDEELALATYPEEISTLMDKWAANFEMLNTQLDVFNEKETIQ